jgi:uncharacterized protein YcbX
VRVQTDYTVTRLSTTPVKGLMLHHPDSIELTELGAVGDRRFYLVDETGNLQSCTRNPGLFGLTATWDEASRNLQVARDGDVLIAGVVEPAEKVETDMFGLRTVEADVVADPAWSAFFSDAVGRPVRLLEIRGAAAYDVHPATLLGTASVDELARRADLPGVDPDRFRMLVEFSGGEPHVEDTWAGRRVEVGGAVVRAGGPVKRCAATTRNPGSGTVDLPTLTMILDQRGRQQSEHGLGANFGIYGAVLQSGTISVGDRLVVADA